MRYMLDTNILIYLLKNKPVSVAQRINQLGEDAQLCMSFFTYAEMLKGAERSTRKNRVLRQLAQLVRQVPVIYHVNHTLCEQYAVHFTYLKESGMLVGANDLWIACHAIAEDAILVTHNTKEFNRIKGLSFEDWVG